MVEVKDNKGNVWNYHIEKRLIPFLDNKVKKSIMQKDKDYVILIDGYEGSGKSTFAQQIARYVDPSLDLSRICMTPEEFKSRVLNADKGQCVIYDEAVTGLTTSDSITKVGKLLKSLMMQMRQKNLFIIIILPSIFELNRYSVLFRSRFFFHVYENHGRRGYFVGYNRRDTRTLYFKGKTNYAYKVNSRFRGRFYGKYTVDEAAYRKKKLDALMSIEDEQNNGKPQWLAQRNLLMKRLHDMKVSYAEISRCLGAGKYPITAEEVSDVVGKLSENDGKVDK